MAAVGAQAAVYAILGESLLGRFLGGWRGACGSINVTAAKPDKPPMSSAPLSPSLATSPASTAMRALVAERARIQRILDFEVALARAQAAVGVVPALATDKIAEAARAERFDLAMLAADVSTGSVATALLNMLRSEVARIDPEAARVVGFGSSEQDALDTALAL